MTGVVAWLVYERLGLEGSERVRATYRESFPRLVEAKRRYDPENRFRVTQNIDPGVTPSAVTPTPPT